MSSPSLATTDVSKLSTMKRPRAPPLLAMVGAFLIAGLTIQVNVSKYNHSRLKYSINENRRHRHLAEISAAGFAVDKMDSEMETLYSSLAKISELLNIAGVNKNEEIMKKAANVIRRVRTLLSAVDNADGVEEEELSTQQEQRGVQEEMKELEKRRKRQRERRRQRLMRRRKVMEMRDERPHRLMRLQRLGLIGSGEEVNVGEKVREHDDTVVEDEQRELLRLHEEERRLYDSTIYFPECSGELPPDYVHAMSLTDCIAEIQRQLAELQKEAEFITHEKRNPDQEGYNKVVIVTDLQAESVKGKTGDGHVEYPFMWREATGERVLGTDEVNGGWDCHAMTPAECCNVIVESVPLPDTKGNYIQCHIFVPFGGPGNTKKDDRVFVTVSQDLLVHEAPFIA